MAQITTKNYANSDFSELISDLQSAYSWKSVQTSEDSSTTTFFVTDNISIQCEIGGTVKKIKVCKNGTVVTETGTTGYFNTKIVKSSKAFCFSYYVSNSLSDITPVSSNTHLIIGTAINQFTKVEETALANLSTSSNGASGYILSSDNLTGVISYNSLPFSSYNLSSKVTSIQNIFYKNSECIMKDVYILTSSQLTTLSFNDCTLNGKKYYMQGAILLADD